MPLSLPSRFSHLALAMVLVPPVAAQDLTGTWRSDRGGRYIVRQAGDEFCWSTDPVNVFCGTVVGTVIVGSWLDLPTGPFRGSGRMILKIESADRFTKVYQSGNYDGSVWTREGTQVAGPVTPTPNPPPVSAPPATRPGGDPGPVSGSSPAAPVIQGGPKDWSYRGIGDEYGDRIGARVEFICPVDAAPTEWRALYGTGVYTGDSVLCQAAIHDGRITAAGGTVVVEVRPGQASYTGRPQHGVISADYGVWGVSFVFVAPDRMQLDVGAPPTRPGAQEGGTLGWEGVVPPEFRTRPGTRISFQCAPGGRFLGYVWGTDVYTGDSYPCAAAVHAGAITFAGGPITIEIRPGQASYTGSARNGVSSGGFGAYPTSFVIVK